MAFITRCWSKFNLGRLAGMFVAALLLGLASPVRAEGGIQIRSAELDLVDEIYQLKAEFEVNFSQALEDALNKGVPLTFAVEFELNRLRWYWFDETVASAQQQIRISYHALTKQYRLQQSEQQKSFATLAELRNEMGHIQDWRVADRSILKKRYAYEARLRVKLDTSQLPKPLQVNALASKEWSLDSEWYRWTLAP